MKTITLWQPWATLIAAGIKTIETRHWPTSYRGPLAIHAARRPIDPADMEEIHEDLIADHSWGQDRCLKLWEDADQTRGHVVATCYLHDCVPLDRFTDRHPQWPWGHFGPGRHGWILQSIRPVDPPVPAKGRQGLWTWYPPAGVRL